MSDQQTPDEQPQVPSLATRQFLPPRNLLPQTPEVTTAWDQTERAITRAEETAVPTLHMEAVHRLVALAGLCCIDPAFSKGPAGKWVEQVRQVGAAVKQMQERYDEATRKQDGDA